MSFRNIILAWSGSDSYRNNISCGAEISTYTH